MPTKRLKRVPTIRKISPIPSRDLVETHEELSEYKTLLSALPTSDTSTNTLDYDKYEKKVVLDLQNATNWPEFKIFLLNDEAKVFREPKRSTRNLRQTEKIEKKPRNEEKNRGRSLVKSKKELLEKPSANIDFPCEKAKLSKEGISAARNVEISKTREKKNSDGLLFLKVEEKIRHLSPETESYSLRAPIQKIEENIPENFGKFVRKPVTKKLPDFKFLKLEAPIFLPFKNSPRKHYEKAKNLKRKRADFQSSLEKKESYLDLKVNQCLKLGEPTFQNLQKNNSIPFEQTKNLKRKKSDLPAKNPYFHKNDAKKTDLVKQEEKAILGDIRIDEPEKIVANTIYDIVQKTPPEKRLFFVEWKKRKSGEKPESSYCNAKDLKEKYPLILLNYYEAKAIFL